MNLTKNERENLRKSESEKKRRSRQKAAGLCIRCGKNRARPNRVNCEVCMDFQKRYREEKRQLGLCVYCSDQRKAIDGTSYCVSCRNKIAKGTQKLRDGRRELRLCVSCGLNHACENKVNCETCAAEARNYHRKNKSQCFDYYGRVCTCCEIEFDERFLTLDHINNDGNQHRSKHGKSGFYKWVINNNFPNNLQTHCWNCNLAKSVNGGVCPHQEMKASFEQYRKQAGL